MASHLHVSHNAISQKALPEMFRRTFATVMHTGPRRVTGLRDVPDALREDIGQLKREEKIRVPVWWEDRRH